jgi:undecaprenyl-diphosphatase
MNAPAERHGTPPAATTDLQWQHAVLIGAVQGLTEFLPISSSAHLALVRRLIGHRQMPRAFDIALHTGTTAALLTDSGRHLASAATSLCTDLSAHRLRWRCYRPASRLAVRLAAATAPAVLVGAFYHGELDAWARRPGRIALTLVAGALPMALAEAAAARGRPCLVEDVPLSTALLMGVAQAAALAPGISRSGATIAAGMFAGLDRESAARFSFLLAVPVTAAATVRTLPAIRSLLGDGGAVPLLTAVVSALAAGLAGIDAMKRLIHARGLRPFVLYRLALAAAYGLLASRSDGDADATRPLRDRPAPR